MFNTNSDQIEKIIDKEMKKVKIDFKKLDATINRESKLVKKLLKLTAEKR